MEVKIFGSDGSATKRTVTLDPSVFEIEPHDHAIWLDVRRIQANARQGTHKAKERGEVRGSTRKLYRQKGTGFARAGDAKSPIRRSGGTIFGPRPRKYSLKVNKKTKQLARRSVLSYKAQDEAFRVVENLTVERASTRDLVALIAGLDLADTKVLVLTGENRPEIYRSSRNLSKVTVREARKASTLDLLSAHIVVIEERAIDTLVEQLGEKQEAAA
jgi:large subunit ribosomal protein L4